MMQAVLLPEVKADLHKGISWFDALKPGLGTEFEFEFLSALERAKMNPEFFSADHTGYRPIRLKRFAAVMYFRPEVDRIVVVGLFVNGRDERKLKS